ncbi:MAG: tetratricopeptide repeat protein [Desulfobacteraceae bacterium]
MRDLKDTYLEILDNGPSEHTVVTVLTKMKEAGLLDEVIQKGSGFLRQYPHNLRLRSLMVESFLEKGFIGRALAEVKELTSLINRLVSPYKAVAEHLAGQGKQMEAAPLLAYYLSHHPEDQEALALLKKTEPEIPSGVEELPVDFATPTIAELYYEQGQIAAAITAYKMVLDKDPDNAEVSRRLQELRDVASKDAADSQGPIERARHPGQERLIEILERWLPKVREIKYAG